MAVILTIDMTDTTGGTGINGAMKTIHALGGYTATVVTALSVQTPQDILHIEPVSAAIIKKQIDSITDQWNIDYVLIGMLPNIEAVDVVGDYLDSLEDKENPPMVVFDPIMISKNGYQFVDKTVVDQMKRRLIRHADMIIPAADEAEQITGMEITDRESAERVAEMVMSFGCGSVMIKDFYRTDSETQDYYMDEEDIFIFATELVDSRKIHGAGTALAAALIVALSMGNSLVDAVPIARSYLNESIAQGIDTDRADQKFGIVQHFV